MSSSTSHVWTISGLTLLGGVAAYAIYFDHKRRSDPAFRRKLRSQKKKVAQKEAEDSKNAGPGSSAGGIPKELLQALYEKVKNDPLPSTFEERHAYFTQIVTVAERLSTMGPDHYIDAALYFFQALRAYPEQNELLTIYKKTLPEPISSLVVELFNYEKMEQGPEKADSVSINFEALDPSSVLDGPPSESESYEWDKLTDPGNGSAAP